MKLLPMKPAPPVTSMFFRFSNMNSSIGLRYNSLSLITQGFYKFSICVDRIYQRIPRFSTLNLKLGVRHKNNACFPKKLTSRLPIWGFTCRSLQSLQLNLMNLLQISRHYVARDAAEKSKHRLDSQMFVGKRLWSSLPPVFWIARSVYEIRPPLKAHSE